MVLVSFGWSVRIMLVDIFGVDVYTLLKEGSAS